MKAFKLLITLILFTHIINAQSWNLNIKNIEGAIKDSSININKDTLRPAYHFTPQVGCMGDPNGGIFYNGYYHIFYGLQPFAFHPGAWYWAHARSKNMLNWEHMKTGMVPDFNLGIKAIGSGSTIVNEDGKVLAFHSQSGGTKGGMKFWHAEFTNEDLTEWKHSEKNPILTLEHPGLPPFDGFWRDPFVFETNDRTFLIACADLLEENYVPVPIFEAKNKELTEWDYKGIMFEVPKHKYRNLEVPEFRKLGDKWILLASTDAPIDRCNYFIGEFDTENLKFIKESEGVLDYSGHYYAQETIQEEDGGIITMAWMPGWDRPWLPNYMNEPIKNNNPLWNGCFAIPRRLTIEDGKLFQKPVQIIKELRGEHFSIGEMELPVSGSTTAFKTLDKIKGKQLELVIKLDIHNASFCGINVLCNKKGIGGLFINWSGNLINIDGVQVPIDNWKQEDTIKLHIFIDKQLVEVFVNDGEYCVSRLVQVKNIKGDNIALTSLGGTAKLRSLDAWILKNINSKYTP